MLSFDAIYQQYFAFVWSSAKRLGISHEALDDVVQEVFIVIHGRLHTLERPESLKSWIYGIVRRIVSAHHRAHRTKLASGARFASESETHAERPPTPLELTEKVSALEVLSRLLAELDEPKRELFSLVELDEMSVPEAAEALEIPLNTAYSRLRAARIAFEEARARHTARSQGRAG